MRKTLIIALAAMLLPTVGHAQLGRMLEKAAKKAVSRTTEKVVDKAVERASDAAASAIEQELDGKLPKPLPSDDEADKITTYADLMRACPGLPTIDELVAHKEAVLNERALKLVASPVTTFSARVLNLSAQCSRLGYGEVDTLTAMRLASAYTGLTEADMQALSRMSEAEQEAWLRDHYSSGRAEQAQLKTAEQTSRLLEQLQPLIDQWTAAGDAAEQPYKIMNDKLLPIYSKYASRIAKASDKERNSLQLAYYTECIPHIRTAVAEVMAARLRQQLPIAEQIEQEMARIRAEHPDAIVQLLNYPKLTAVQYFGEVARLLEIPDYNVDR